MGKRIIARARGKGGPRYRAPSHRYLGRVEYFPPDKVKGVVVDIVHDPGRSAPVAIVKAKGKKLLHIAAEGVMVGDEIAYGEEIKSGNVAYLAKIPEGTKVFGIESFPGSGPKFCRSSGTFAIVLGRTKDRVAVQFSSGEIRELNANCRATIGVPAAMGRPEKPWSKAGLRLRALAARGKLFPRAAGVAMGPVDHPYGGRARRPRVSRFVSRHLPPGAKVGSISPKRVKEREGG